MYSVIAIYSYSDYYKSNVLTNKNAKSCNIYTGQLEEQLGVWHEHELIASKAYLAWNAASIRYFALHVSPNSSTKNATAVLSTCLMNNTHM